MVGVTSSTGTSVEKRFYDDFGNVLDETKQSITVSGVGNPYAFQGRRLDEETGIYYFRNRYYDPEKGRFLQRDPVWDAGNVGNQYSFVGNGPVSRTDALGEFGPFYEHVEKTYEAYKQADREGYTAGKIMAVGGGALGLLTVSGTYLDQITGPGTAMADVVAGSAADVVLGRITVDEAVSQVGRGLWSHGSRSDSSR